MLEVLKGAHAEVRQAMVSYDDQRAGLGEKFLRELRLAFGRIVANPARFGRAEQCPTADEVRQCRLNRFPYVVYFQLRSNDVLVVAVSHAKREPVYWIERLS